MCGWEVSAGSELAWNRYRINGAPFTERPYYDHTTRSQEGHYLQLVVNGTTQRGSEGYISYFLAPISDSTCVMRTWVYMKGNDNGQLRVGYRTAIGDNITFILTKDDLSCATDAISCQWQRISVPLSPIMTQPIEVSN